MELQLFIHIMIKCRFSNSSHEEKDKGSVAVFFIINCMCVFAYMNKLSQSNGVVTVAKEVEMTANEVINIVMMLGIQDLQESSEKWRKMRQDAAFVKLLRNDQLKGTIFDSITYYQINLLYRV